MAKDRKRRRDKPQNAPKEEIKDLDVPEEKAEDVKGGLARQGGPTRASLESSAMTSANSAFDGSSATGGVVLGGGSATQSNPAGTGGAGGNPVP
jgi:hypothetical protein